MTSAIRTQDKGLLARLEGEVALARALESSGLSALPRRASGAVELLRAHGAEAELERALDGDAAPLRARLLCGPLEGLPPPLLHHLAVLADHALDVALTRAQEDPSAAHLAALSDGFVRSARAWLLLSQSRDYLTTLTARTGVSLEGHRLEAVLEGLALRGITRAQECARQALEGLTPIGQCALTALHTLQHSLSSAHAATDHAAAGDVSSADLAPPMRARAQATIAAGLEALVTSWLAQFRDDLDGLVARGAIDEVARLTTHAAASWRWLGHEPELERHVLTALPTLCWPLYRRRALGEIDALLAPVLPMAGALEQRVHEDRASGAPSRDLAYIAPCAQVLVFWAEVPRDIAVALPRIERAYALCPTLRNARVVLAHVLCDRAEHTLAQPLSALPVVGSLPAAREDVSRAARVYPELDRLVALKKRVGLAP